MCIQDILGTPLDYDKARKHMEDAKLELGDVKIVVAIIAFFITNAAKNGVDENTLAEELQQLGLPKGEKNHPLACHLCCLCLGRPHPGADDWHAGWADCVG
jgi:hypothetical protein